MSRVRRYYKIETKLGTFVRSTNWYFLAVVIVDGGDRGVFFCRDWRRGDQVHSRELRLFRDVVTRMPSEISKEEYDAIRSAQKVGA